MAYYVYIVRCNDGSLYTGYTTDVQRRVWEHNNSDRGAKFTHAKRPCMLVYSEEFSDKSSAMKREYYIKHNMTKSQKEELVK